MAALCGRTRATLHLLEGRRDIRGRRRAPVVCLECPEVGGFAGCRFDGDRGVVQATEVSHGDDDQEQDRDDERELHHRLAGLATVGAARRSGAKSQGRECHDAKGSR